jgi:hypothetical protein
LISLNNEIDFDLNLIEKMRNEIGMGKLNAMIAKIKEGEENRNRELKKEFSEIHKKNEVCEREIFRLHTSIKQQEENTFLLQNKLDTMTDENNILKNNLNKLKSNYHTLCTR